ncbi:TapB family protein [Dyadobacter luticola]|uniref:DUF3108 domain-containing protein n=1 Tax=Dyadobacter luticola TaxID=1979387 RepID=A0A5R9KX47_9BACT|nr:hypothetical protein [Dyadobacter luticola]TLV00710.1 hypothetical protein FEN17_14600 [Dyadobacter luticola]
MRRSKAVMLPLAIALLSLVSCKDDPAVDPDENNPPVAEKAFIPEKNKTYSYKISDSDGGVSNSVLRVTSVKDSSGIPVSHIENVIEEEDDKIILNYRAFSHGGHTTNELSIPAGFNSMQQYVQEFAYIDDYELSGFPQVQVFDNKGTVDSKVTFSTKPVKMHLELTIPVSEEESIPAQMDCTIQYADGKAIAQENITTPAGTFNCTKWLYSYELYGKLTAGQSAPEEVRVVYTVTEWTAPGVGVVKSVEASGEDVTTTELQKIQ